jgi:hypothetical protein
MYDIDSMDDGELKSLIEQELSEHPDLGGEDVTIQVASGRVTVEGRVGTEVEYQAIEHVITDLIGIKEISNDLVVDGLRRDEQPEAADELAAERAARGDSGSDGAGDQTSDEAQHLMDDTAGEQFGTSDMGEAIQQGYSYHPPDNPVQEGTWSRENH